MRIDVFFADRVGIAQEVLAELARRSLNVTAVEVDPPHIYIEAPALDQAGLDALRAQLMQVSGVRTVEPVGMLPGAQRRLYLDALLASQADPIFAVDEAGCVVLANNAAIIASGLDEAGLIGSPMQDLIGNPKTAVGRGGLFGWHGGSDQRLRATSLISKNSSWSPSLMSL